MGESERKGKKAGELKASRQKETFINGDKGQIGKKQKNVTKRSKRRKA